MIRLTFGLKLDIELEFFLPLNNKWWQARGRGMVGSASGGRGRGGGDGGFEKMVVVIISVGDSGVEMG